MRSEKLRVRVVEAGFVKVDLSLNARAAANLPKIVPPHVAEKLGKRAVDLGALSTELVANEFPQGPIFDYLDGDKSVRVWLE